MIRNPLKDPSLAYALAVAREKLMPADSTITSVGIGYGTKAGHETGEICLQIGVEEKLPKESLEPSKLLPRSVRPPGAGADEIRLDVVKTGVLARRDLDLRSHQRPAMPGVSVAHARSTAGTLGAVLTDRRRRRYILSNNHVLANENDAAAGDAILQPGPVDGGTEPESVIGRLLAFVPLDFAGVNQVDCAVASAERDRDLVPAVHGVGTILGSVAPELGAAVRKCGRTTGLTSGRIRRVAVTARIHYSGGVLIFSGLAETGGMSAPGDSGSLMVDASNSAVGLLFAGSALTTLMCPIASVLAALELGDMVFY